MREIINKIKGHPFFTFIITVIIGVIGNTIYDLIKGEQVFSTIKIFLNFDLKVWWILAVLLVVIIVIIFITRRKGRTARMQIDMSQSTPMHKECGELTIHNEANITPPSLDFSTLSKFIMTNDKIKEFDEFLCTQPNSSISIHSDEIVFFHLRRLYWVGVLTPEDLLNKIDTYYDFIIHFSKTIRKDKSTSSQILPGTLIYYVCYCIIFQEQSINKIISFWEIDGYKATNKDRDNASNFLLIYNQFFSADKKDGETP